VKPKGRTIWRTRRNADGDAGSGATAFGCCVIKNMNWAPDEFARSAPGYVSTYKYEQNWHDLGQGLREV